MHDGTGNDLAERSANADRRADGPEGEIESAGASRQIGDHEYGHNAEDARRDVLIFGEGRFRVSGVDRSPGAGEIRLQDFGAFKADRLPPIVNRHQRRVMAKRGKR